MTDLNTKKTEREIRISFDLTAFLIIFGFMALMFGLVFALDNLVN